MKLNNRGQSLVLFLIILPIIVAVLAYLVDMTLITYEKNKNYQVTKSLIEISLNEGLDEEEIINLFKKNDVNSSNLVVKLSDQELIVENEYEIDLVFGNIIGIKKYTIKLNIKGIKEENNISFIKE